MAYVRATPEMTEAAHEAVRTCRDYAEELERPFPTGESAKALENAKQMALIAIDELVDRLGSARPNDEAVALGIGW
ncbi:hypothetical protein [Microvirga sp. M2]|uniref:hypothetical protein n=1 Tax=Microvirga sp. M2 TaxID=3073270 RepID=UPI0039C2D779